MKKFLLLILVLTLCFALASCGYLPDSITSIFGDDEDGGDCGDMTDDTVSDGSDDTSDTPDDNVEDKEDDTPHTHGYYVEAIVEPTCTDKGYIQYKCECGSSHTSDTDGALGHDEQYRGAKAPTCTEEGWDAYVVCSRCDYSTRGENKPAKGHRHDTSFDVLNTDDDGNYYVEGYCYDCKTDVVITFTSEFRDFTLTKDNRGLLTLSAMEAVIPAIFYSEGVWYKVTTIGDSAFKNQTTLESVVIPNTVTVITDSAFEGCTGIKEIPLPEGLVTIGECAFKGCSSVNKMLIIPDTVTEICTSAFEGCSKLSTMRGGKGLVTVGENAFLGTRLSMYYYTGSKDEFKAVTIYDSKLKSTQTWYYSEEKANGCWHYVNGSVQPWM